jgi:hypothetical protein
MISFSEQSNNTSMNEDFVQGTREIYCDLISVFIREVLGIDWARNSNNFAVRHHPLYAGFQIIVAYAM